MDCMFANKGVIKPMKALNNACYLRIPILNSATVFHSTKLYNNMKFEESYLRKLSLHTKIRFCLFYLLTKDRANVEVRYYILHNNFHCKEPVHSIIANKILALVKFLQTLIFSLKCSNVSITLPAIFVAAFLRGPYYRLII